MTEIVLFHLLAAIAGASFGLMVIGAAVGRWPWLLRFALVAAVIGCLIVVPAFDVAVGAVSQALLIATALWGMRRFKLARVEARESPPNRARWLRFSMSDLLRATLLIAAVFAVAAYMPTDERRSWWKYALTGSRFGVATLVGAWAGISRRGLWPRLGVLFLAAPLAGGRWWAVTLGVGFLISAWICLARRSRLLPAPCGIACGSVSEASKQRSLIFRPPLTRAALATLSLIMVLPPIAAYYDMLHAVPVPTGPLPEPNAYEEVLRIAVLLAPGTSSSSAPSSAAEPNISPEQRRSGLFDELHDTLLRPSAVPIQYKLGYTNLDAIQAIRQLARDLHAEGARQRLAEKPRAARHAYLDLVELGLVTGRGGFIVDRLVGIAIADMGIEGLRQIGDELSSDERRALILALQTNETAWEPLGQLHDRECAAVDKIVGWPSRIRFAFPPDLRPPTQALAQADRRRLAKTRLLIGHLAIAQYMADHSRPPRDLVDLVPDYLDRVPEDPFSNQPMVYKAAPPGYLLYSVNQDGRDEGGRHRPSPTDGDLFLDAAEVKAR